MSTASFAGAVPRTSSEQLILLRGFIEDYKKMYSDLVDDKLNGLVTAEEFKKWRKELFDGIKSCHNIIERIGASKTKRS